jgi:FAD/FMN-containing dehydrogenase
VVDCHERHHAELFWALRGAGAGNLGVVTSFTFQLRPAAGMTNFHLAWAYGQATAVIAAWQRWAPQGPDELAAELVLTGPGEPAAEPTVELYGTVLGTLGDAGKLLERLIPLVGADPRSQVCTELSYRDTIRYQAAPSASGRPAQPPGRSSRRGRRFTKSEFFDRPLPAQAITALVAGLADRRAPGQDRSVAFTPWGGAYRRRSPQATAFAHRQHRFLLEQLVVVAPSASAAEQRAAHRWVRRSWACVHPWGSGGVYPNFPDPELADWGRAYHGDNYARLRKVTAKYDPDAAFRFNQALRAR